MNIISSYRDFDFLLYPLLAIGCLGIFYLLSVNKKRKKDVTSKKEDTTGKEEVSKKIFEEEELKKLLIDYLEQEKTYLNPTLSMNDICSCLKTNRTYLSALLNDSLNTNFYSLINDYRIKYAIDLMQSSQGKLLKMDEIAEQSGFKSRSVFYKEFKKHTGSSPMHYLRETFEGNKKISTNHFG